MSPKPCPECSGIQKAIEVMSSAIIEIKEDQKDRWQRQRELNDRLFEKLDQHLVEIKENKIEGIQELSQVTKKLGKTAFIAAISGGFVFALVEFLIPVLAKIFQGG